MLRKFQRIWGRAEPEEGGIWGEEEPNRDVLSQNLSSAADNFSRGAVLCPFKFSFNSGETRRPHMEVGNPRNLTRGGNVWVHGLFRV